MNNLVVISDLHVGCQLGLCSPVAQLDEGGEYHATWAQQVLWSWWKEFWSEWVPEVTRGEDYAIVLNGDAIDGTHHGVTTQWTQNLADQRREAERILAPVIKDHKYYHLRGTEAHAGKSGIEEETLARSLGAIPNFSGQCARWELWVQIGDGQAHITHHIGTAGSMHYESSALTRELSEAYAEAARWGGETPQWLVRSHRHRCGEWRIMTSKGFATICVTAGWQLKTPFAYKVAGARQATPQIGGTLLRCGDKDCYTRHFVRAPGRERVEL